MNKIFTLFLLLAFVMSAKTVSAQNSQTSQSMLYVPLIGITSVPNPLALPKGPGDVTYNYAVKSFISGVSLTDVHVADDKCGAIKFIEGDDNLDSKLDYRETWRYTCSTWLSTTTESITTTIGTANKITATHKAYATVIVGSDSVPPLVSVINITKVAYPLSLPVEGGEIIFTYKVNNPGEVPLSDVAVTDDKCSSMSGKLGDTNVNNLLDMHEVWIYTCKATLTKTTMNTVRVAAFANGLKAVGEATIIVKVETPVAYISPSLPDTGLGPNVNVIAWAILSGVLAAIIVFLFLTRKKKFGRFAVVIVLIGIAVAGFYFLLLPRIIPDKSIAISDQSFGWRFPISKFPLTGTGSNQLSYSDIRDPGGVPQGLPVRLKIPVIGVDSAIEDALITPDGRMDVPSGSVNVAWFALGPQPGEIGSSVIGGHYGIKNGLPFVFYKLDKLQVGDKIYIVNDKGETLWFVIRSIGLFERDADATKVFTSDDGLAHLNLITCEGVWNKVNDSYPLRRVIFADAVPVIAGAAPDIIVFYRSLNIGSQGADVVALQSALIQKGFFTLPPGVVKGFYGSLTSAAVSKYQTSVDLPSVGAFGPLTRAKMILELVN